MSDTKKRSALAPAGMGFRPIFASHPRWMLAVTVLLAVVAVLGVLFVGQGQLNLYQGF